MVVNQQDNGHKSILLLNATNFVSILNSMKQKRSRKFCNKDPYQVNCSQKADKVANKNLIPLHQLEKKRKKSLTLRTNSEAQKTPLR